MPRRALPKFVPNIKDDRFMFICNQELERKACQQRVVSKMTRCTSQREGIIFSSKGRCAFARMESEKRRSRAVHKGAARGSHAEPSLTFVVMWIKRARRHEAVRLVWSGQDLGTGKHMWLFPTSGNKTFSSIPQFCRVVPSFIWKWLLEWYFEKINNKTEIV